MFQNNYFSNGEVNGAEEADIEARAILEAIAEVLAEHEQVISAWDKKVHCHCPSVYNELLRMSSCLLTLIHPGYRNYLSAQTI